MNASEVSVGSAQPAVVDALGRGLHDLRLSITDRCNFRCPYCMPKEVFGSDYAFLEPSRTLQVDELLRLAALARRCGVEKVRVTGGEPLLRAEVVAIVEGLKRQVGIPEVALTTNGVRLADYAARLKAAGLDRVNVSVDGVSSAAVGDMNGIGASARRTLAGIDAALAVGLPVKLNMVVLRGRNEAEVPEVLAFARGRKLPVRFIEFMDAGNHNHWDPALVVTARELLQRLPEATTLRPVEPAYRGEVAARWRYPDGFEVGFITSVSQPFCGDCQRARLSADGRLFTCLFAATGHDLLGPLRAGATDAALEAVFRTVWRARRDRYSEERAALIASGVIRPKAEMSYLGG